MTVDRREMAAQLVELVREALIDLDWETVRSLADAAGRIDSGNVDASRYLAAANEALKKERSVPRVLLHEELVAVLAESSADGLTYSQLAVQVNERRRYQRRDGGPVPAEQIRARIAHRTYRHLFRIEGGRVHLRD